MDYELECLKALVETLKLVEDDIRKTRQKVEEIYRYKRAKRELENDEEG